MSFVVLLLSLFVITVCSFIPTHLQCGNSQDIFQDVTSYPHEIRGAELDVGGGLIAEVAIIFNNNTPTATLQWLMEQTKVGGLRFSWVHFYEKQYTSPTSEVYNSFSLEDNIIWEVSKITTDSCEGTFFKGNLPGGSQLEICYYIFKTNTILEYGPYDFDILTNSVKFSLYFSNYSYEPETYSLPTFKVITDFDEDFSAVPDLDDTSGIDFNDPDFTLSIPVEHGNAVPFRFVPKENKITKRNEYNDDIFSKRASFTFSRTTMNLTFFDFGVIETKNSTVYPEISRATDFGFDQTFSSVTQFVMNLTFEADFNEGDALYYDPSLDVLVAFNQDGEDGDGDDESLDGGAIAGIVIGCIVFFVIVVVIVALVIIGVGIFNKKRAKGYSTKGIEL
eukprot:TRINITY_DN2760_c0_g1_i2.p1 TRINITY_DN2760_c0_g1~~TRINITY_DN2760_c0_g1_i2.p1  ORF type:complete len:392 (-),score=61.35 TRINITY_DN2760_c0_g1_i2:171-1346(-)